MVLTNKTAIPAFTSVVPSSFNIYELNETVYWESSDPINAPISNVPKPDLLTDSSPIAQFTDPPQTSGIIHWLPSSSGKTVTFTATRFKPDGTVATGNIDITNDFTNPLDLGFKIWTDAINIYPIGYTIHGDDMMNSGFYIYVTAHQTDGQFQDITGIAQITADNDAVIISPDGRVKATSILPSGTTVTITAYDHTTLMYPLGYLLPNGESRAFDTCTITIL